MYIPSAFNETRIDVLHAFVAAHPLATLVTNGPDGLFASHVPMMLDADGGTLLAHVARGNGHWRLLDGGAPTLAVFGGPNAYVSPDWYPNKHRTGKDVPTTLYDVVYKMPTRPSLLAAELGADIDRVLAVGLAKDRAARFDTAAAFAEALAAAIEDKLEARLRARADALVAAHAWGHRL